MLTTDEAFRKFKSRLELNDREQKNASARQTEVREYLDTKFAIANSFLTGSYARYTKTKPLKDIDIFVVLKDSERRYRDDAPSKVIEDFHKALADKYGENAVRKQSRSVNVDFGVVIDADDNTDYRIVSIDVVPAFAAGDNYEIPDTDSGKWIKTNPKIHAEKATAAHQAYSNEWKGLVRMVKYWNNNPRHGKDKPVKPSFLIEVMALQCLYGGWQGRKMPRAIANRSSRRRWPIASSINGPTRRGWGRRSATAWTMRASSVPATCCRPPAAMPATPSISRGRNRTARR
jgi:predicted nucleotidyltransferase